MDGVFELEKSMHVRGDMKTSDVYSPRVFRVHFTIQDRDYVRRVIPDVDD